MLQRFVSITTISPDDFLCLGRDATLHGIRRSLAIFLPGSEFSTRREDFMPLSLLLVVFFTIALFAGY